MVHRKRKKGNKKGKEKNRRQRRMMRSKGYTQGRYIKRSRNGSTAGITKSLQRPTACIHPILTRFPLSSYSKLLTPNLTSLLVLFSSHSTPGTGMKLGQLHLLNG